MSKPKLWKTPEEKEAEENEEKPTVEELKYRVKELQRIGRVLPKWLLLKQASSILYIIFLGGISFSQIGSRYGVAVFVILAPLMLLLVDYLKLIQRVKKEIVER